MSHSIERTNSFEEPPCKLRKISEGPFLPDELWAHIFSFLDRGTLNNSSLVCHQWRKWIEDPLFFEKKYAAFGKKSWSEWGIEVSGLPPQELISYLNSSCPISPDKLVKQTHDVFHMPAKLELEQFLQCVSDRNISFSTSLNSSEKNFFINHPMPYWAVVYKGPFPGTLGKYFTDKKKVVEEFNQKHQNQYEIPNLLETLVFLYVMVHAKNHAFEMLSSPIYNSESMLLDLLLLSSDEIATFHPPPYRAGIALDSEKKLEIDCCTDDIDANWGVLGFRRF